MTETWLKYDETMAISFFHEPRADQRAGGGVGVLVSDQLKTEMCVEPKHPKVLRVR